MRRAASDASAVSSVAGVSVTAGVASTADSTADSAADSLAVAAAPQPAREAHKANAVTAAKIRFSFIKILSSLLLLRPYYTIINVNCLLPVQQIPFSTVCKELYGLHTLLRNDAPHKPFARHDGRRAGHADGLLCAAGAPLRQRRAAADGGLRDPRSRPCAGRCYHGKQTAGRRLYRRHGPYGAGRRLCRRAGGRAQPQPRQCLRR